MTQVVTFFSRYHYSFDVVFLPSAPATFGLPVLSGSTLIDFLDPHGIHPGLRLHRTGHLRVFIFPYSHPPQHRYPAYCWVSHRRWHSYPTARGVRPSGSRLVAVERTAQPDPSRVYLIALVSGLFSVQLVSLHRLTCMLSHLHRIAFPPLPSPSPSSANLLYPVVAVFHAAPALYNRRYRRARRKTNTSTASKPRLYGRLEGRSRVFISSLARIGGTLRPPSWGISTGLPLSWPASSPPCVFLGFGTFLVVFITFFFLYRSVLRAFFYFPAAEICPMFTCLPFMFHYDARMPFPFPFFPLHELHASFFLYHFFGVLPHSVSISHHRHHRQPLSPPPPSAPLATCALVFTG